MLIDWKRYAEHPALLLEQGEQITYGELEGRVRRFMQRLAAGRGLLILEADNSLPTMVGYLAALEARCPIILTEAGATAKVERIKNSFSITYHYQGNTDTLWSNRNGQAIEIDEALAVLLSTSGSTGAAKYVCLSHENLVHNARAIADYLNVTPADRAPTNLPFFYSYGLSVVNSHLTVGASLFLTNLSVMEKAFWPLFDQVGCTSFAGVPHTYEMLESMDFSTAEHPGLRYATQAGGRLSQQLIVKNAERARDEGWQFFVMYGQTEAAPRMAYLPPELTLRFPACIGRAIPGGELTLVDTEGRLIDQPDREGELVYTGPNVMMGYAEGDRDLSKIEGTGILHTGDLACRNAEGLYSIVGRSNRFVKIFGLRISLDRIEEYLAEQQIKAVCGGTDACLYILITQATDAEQVKKQVADWLGIPLFAVFIHTTSALPLHANGKIDYTTANTLLAEAHARSQQEQARKQATAVGAFARTAGSNLALVKAVFSSAVGEDIDDDSCSLRDIGADSLSIVEIRMQLEKYIQNVPGNWLDLPIRSLAGLFARERIPPWKRLLSFTNIESYIVLRALAIMAVVAHHYGLFLIPGGTTTLLFIIGGYLYWESNRDTLYANGARYKLWTGLIVLISTLVPITLAQAVMHSLVGNHWHISLLVPYENVVTYLNDVTHTVDTSHHVHWLWFIHAYLQVFFVLALLGSLRPVRHYLARRPYEKVLWLFLLAELLSTALIVADSVRQDLGHSAALLQYAPTTIAPVVLFGALISLTHSVRERLLTLAAAASYALLFWGGVYHRGGIMTLISILILLFFPVIRLPGLFNKPLMMISEASLFIYLIHMPFQFVAKKVLGEEFSPLLMVGLGLVVAMGLWIPWKTVVIVRIRRLLAGKRQEGLAP